MTDEDIRKAAWHAYMASKHDITVDRVADAYRAGMDAGRAAERRCRGRLSDPAEAALFLAEIDTRGVLNER